MTIQSLTDHAGEWLRGTGPQSDIVISSRIRYARNLAGFPFVNRADARQRREVLRRCEQAIVDQGIDEDVLWVDLSTCPVLDRQLLVERHLISRQHANDRDDVPRAVAIGNSETFAVMINEEDHLRLQVLRSGMQLTAAHEHIEHLDNLIEQKVDYAFSKKWGYLTACPTNVGTGLRVSVMLHLPALKLTGEIEKVQRAARDMHLAVRGLFGEGSEAAGDLYQVSNQTTLGKTELELLADFEHSIVPQIIAYEQQARQALQHHRPDALDDKIHRAWGVLTHARLIGTDETLQHLSHLRLGVNLGRLQTVDLPVINELFLLTQPAHLQKLSNQELDPAARRLARASLIRQKLLSR